jgi:pyruvate-formate lyase
MNNTLARHATAIHQCIVDDPMDAARQARYAIRFTALHKAYAEAHSAAREAALLAVQLPEIFQPIRSEDEFAGRILYPPIGVSPEPGGFGCYANGAALEKLASVVADDLAVALRDAMTYWNRHSSWALAQRRITARDGWRSGAENSWTDRSWAGAPLYRIAGLCPDLPRLMRRGLPGLRADVRARRDGDPETTALCEAWLSSLDAVERVLAGYAIEAAAMGRQNLATMCTALRQRAPATLGEGLQLALILSGAAGLINFGRCDDAFGLLLADDLTAGRLDEQGAVTLVLGWFRLLATRRTIYNGRVVLGGAGRQHPEAADVFCRIALQATRRQKDIEPQVSLRLHDGQDPQLLELALDCLADGCTYPILYHDAVNVPAVQRAFLVDRQTAETYVPYGCGEYVLGPSSIGTPNSLLNIAHLLDLCLHGRAPGQDGRLPTWRHMGELWEDLLVAMRLVLRDLAHCQVATYEAIDDTCRLLLPSLLTDGPLERGRGLLSGGIRYRGGTMEVYGLTNAADSLTALEQVVFTERRCDLATLRAALDADFRGSHAGLGAMLRRQPKFGNDHIVADRWYCRLHDAVCDATRNQAPSVGLHHFLTVNINNWANTLIGRHTAATADGRHAGTPLANANGPSSGADREGPSAVLASQAKPDPGLLAGMTQNLKLSREWFRGERGAVKSLLAQYFAAGGSQVMITISDHGELQAAMERPQEYGQLLVRVGGFSARFVDLPRDCQQEILSRTLH